MMPDIDILDKPYEPMKEPSSLARLCGLIEQANLSHQIDNSVLEVLREHSKIIYALREDNKRLIAVVRSQATELRAEKQLRAQLNQIVGDLRRKVGV